MEPASSRLQPEDPEPSMQYLMVTQPPKGAEFVEWYEFLGAMIAWDMVRSVFTAWLTKKWISKKPKKGPSCSCKGNK